MVIGKMFLVVIGASNYNYNYNHSSLEDLAA